MNLLELRNRLIEDGIASLKKADHRPECIEGGIEGFELCKEIEPTLEAFESVLKERAHVEALIRKRGKPAKDIMHYWRYRYGTLQIEHVYQVLRVAYKASPLSDRACMQYAKIVGVAE